MKVTIHAQGNERKRLVKTVSGFLGCAANYCGMPTFNYEVGGFTIERDGDLSFDDQTDSSVVEGLLQRISDEGFDIELDRGDEDEGPGLTVSIPLSKVSVENLKNLLSARGTLVKKALGINDLPVNIEEDCVSFPWFSKMPDEDTVTAYTDFIAALCKMSKEQQHISPTERPTDNEKYTFRCFLVRLGFVGYEHKTTRHILMRNMTGCGSYRNGGPKHEISE